LEDTKTKRDFQSLIVHFVGSSGKTSWKYFDNLSAQSYSHVSLLRRIMAELKNSFQFPESLPGKNILDIVNLSRG
jgi:hypothetical protein